MSDPFNLIRRRPFDNIRDLFVGRFDRADAAVETTQGREVPVTFRGEMLLYGQRQAGGSDFEVAYLRRLTLRQNGWQPRCIEHPERAAAIACRLQRAVDLAGRRAVFEQVFGSRQERRGEPAGNGTASCGACQDRLRPHCEREVAQ